MSGTRLLSSVQILLLAWLLVTNPVAASNSKSSESPIADEFAVVAYWFGDTANVDQYAIGDLTHIIYSFLHLKGNKLTVDAPAQDQDLQTLVALKEQFPKLKVLVAFGGWGGCEHCSAVFSNAANREAFAQSVRELLLEYRLDGIDLDWEYPAIEGYPGHPFSPSDRENFTALVQELRQQLGSRFMISLAAGASAKYWRESVDWQQILPLIDAVNLMTYDLISGSGDTAQHHTPLYPTIEQDASAFSCVQHLLELGIEAKKINVGAAFYARVWDQVDVVAGKTLYRPARFKEFVDYRDLASYFASRCTTAWDPVAQAPYCHQPSEGLFVSYDDAQSIAAKTSYAREHGLGGIMFWQLAQDTYTDGLLAAITQVLVSERQQNAAP